MLSKIRGWPLYYKMYKKSPGINCLRKRELLQKLRDGISLPKPQGFLLYLGSYKEG